MISWAKVSKNTTGRDFVIGDIHGEFDKVDRLLLKAKFDEEVDRLFAVGDLIDRGDQNEDVLKWLLHKWFFSIQGNHEQMLLAACQPGPDRESYARMHFGNGGEWFYALDHAKQQQIYDALLPLPIIMEIECEIGSVGLVHADVPGFEWKDVLKAVSAGNERAINTALWGRERIRRKDTKPINGIEKVFVGHTPVKFTHCLGNVQFIDTGGCFTDGHLTLMDINTGEVWTES